jgi:hypothetical protein
LERERLAFGGAFGKRQPGTAAVWKTKVQNFFKSPYVFGQPELLLKVVLVAKVLFVAPADAKPLLPAGPLSLMMLLYFAKCQ